MVQIRDADCAYNHNLLELSGKWNGGGAISARNAADVVRTATSVRKCGEAQPPSTSSAALVRSTETSWLTPRSAMVTPKRRLTRLMVIA